MTLIGIEYNVQNRIKKQRTEEGKFHLRSCFWHVRNIDVSNLFL